MWSYVGRRLLIAVFVIFAASYLVYVLSANSGDPLEALRGSTAPNKEQLMAALTAQLHLDVPPFLRYFIWLGGVFSAATSAHDRRHLGQHPACAVGVVDDSARHDGDASSRS